MKSDNALKVIDQNIAGSEFNDVNMAHSVFENINMSHSIYHDINFSDVMFTAAQIGGTTFKHIGPPPDKEGKQIRQRPVLFEECMLCDSTIRRSDLQNVKIESCNMDGMTIDGVLVSDLLSLWRDK